MMLDGCNKRQFRLLPAQGAQLAQHSRRVFFLFLAWITSRPDLEDPWLGLDEIAHRRLLGALTALSWFGSHEESCVSRLWQHRATLHEPGILAHVTGTYEDRVHLLPLVPPEILRCAVQNRVIDPFKEADDDLWSNWQFHNHFANDPQDLIQAANWYSSLHNLVPVGSEDDVAQHRSNAWRAFVNALIDKRELTLYAQRGSLLNWFPDYDPASADRKKGTDHPDQPWDFDHILPSKYKSAHYVPNIIREWQRSLGNLRAWPAEVNRSDGATPPIDKLCEPDADASIDSRELKCYNLTSQTARLKASSITTEELELWREACPNEGEHSNYLAQSENKHKRCMVLRVITARWVRLYEDWYKDLKIADLTLVGGAVSNP